MPSYLRARDVMRHQRQCGEIINTEFDYKTDTPQRTRFVHRHHETKTGLHAGTRFKYCVANYRNQVLLNTMNASDNFKPIFDELRHFGRVCTIFFLFFFPLFFRFRTITGVSFVESA